MSPAAGGVRKSHRPAGRWDAGRRPRRGSSSELSPPAAQDRLAQAQLKPLDQHHFQKRNTLVPDTPWEKTHTR